MIKEIVKKYKDGKLNNETDEKYAGGFWDLAGDIAGTYNNRIMENGDVEDLQETIYQALTILHREMDKKKV